MRCRCRLHAAVHRLLDDMRHGVDKRLQVGAVRLLDDVLRQPVNLKPLYGRGGKQVLAGEHDIVGELDQLLRKRDDLILKLTRKMPGINVEQVGILTQGTLATRLMTVSQSLGSHLRSSRVSSIAGITCAASWTYVGHPPKTSSCGLPRIHA